jgi:cytidylate kinase
MHEQLIDPEQLKENYGLLIAVSGLGHAVGASTISTTLAEALDIPRYNAGNIRRFYAVEWAKKRDEFKNLDFDHLDIASNSQIINAFDNWLHEDQNAGYLTELDRCTDEAILTYGIEASLKQGGGIIEGKAAAPLSQTDYFKKLCKHYLKGRGFQKACVPAFSVLVKCDPAVSAQRDRSRDLKINPKLAEQNPEEIAKDLKEREESLKKRMADNLTHWQTFYNLDTNNLKKYYQLIVDTTNYKEEEMDLVVSQILQFLLTESRFTQTLSDQQKTGIYNFIKKQGIYL